VASVDVLALKVGRRHLPERAVPPARVVPALDVAEQRYARLGLGRPTVPIDQLALERGEEALGHRVVVGVAHGAHRRPHAHLLAALAEGDAGVLPWSLWWITPLGLRCCSAMFSAASTSSAVICSPMAQPTMRRLQSTAAIGRWPLEVTGSRKRSFMVPRR
jgi:hypothetical protein